MPQRPKRLRRKNSDKQRQATNPTIRYPRRSLVDALLLAMAGQRSRDMVRDPRATTNILHLWAFACVDYGTANDFDVVTIDPRSGERSPILDAAEHLIRRVPKVWGFGLAYSAHAEFWAAVDGIPEAAVHAAQAESLKDRPTADEICAATIFDARGRAFTSAVYLHMPELGPVKWQENTTSNAVAVNDWVRRFDAGFPTAHTWAAALALDPTHNKAALRRLRTSPPSGDATHIPR